MLTREFNCNLNDSWNTSNLAVHPLPQPAGSLAEFEEVAHLISQARRKVWSGVARVFAAEGEAVLGWAVVSVLTRYGPQSQRALAEIIAQHPAGISRQLAELDRAGMTTRTEDALDRRRHLVDLTAQGRQWYRRGRPKVMDAVRDVLGVLNAAERKALRVLLSKVLAPRALAQATERGRSRETYPASGAHSSNLASRKRRKGARARGRSPLSPSTSGAK